jgi:hypothetical protein
LRQSVEALQTCELSLRLATSKTSSLSRELWVWRGATALAVIGCAGGLLWGFGRQ